MPTLVDSFLVTFGLDPEGYTDGSKKLREENKRNREDVEKTDGRIQRSNKATTQSFSKMKNEVVGLVAAFAGTASLAGFLSKLATGDAAAGRLAQNLGVATAELSTWQSVAASAGGTAADADAAFRKLAGAFQSYRLTGNSGINDDLRGLNVSLEDFKNPATALLKMAEAGERMDRAQFFQRLAGIGIPESLITVLAEGRKETEKLVEARLKDGVASDESAAAAIRFAAAVSSLQKRLEDNLRPAMTAVLEGLGAFLTNADAISVIVPVITGIMGALAVATLAAAWPWVLLASGIAAATYAWAEYKGTAASGPQGVADMNTRLRNQQPAWLRSILGTEGDYPGGTGGNKSAARPANVPTGGGRGGDAAFLRSSGFSEPQIRGIRAGIHAEGGHERAVNPTSGAFGVGQWLGPRKKELFNRYGNNPTRAQQLEFLVWELKGGDHGGKHVMGASTEEGALDAYIRKFMRPAAGAETEGDLRRGRAFLNRPRAASAAQVAAGGARPGITARGGAGGGRAGNTSSQNVTIGQITVYTPGTDGKAIARDLPEAIQRRGLALQATGGLS